MAPAPTPILTPLNLSKALEHEHPDIEPDVDYLVQINGRLYAGRFDRQWFGWNFRWVAGSIQFDAPGWNSSLWEAVWRIDRPPADLAGRELPKVWEGMTVRDFAENLGYTLSYLCDLSSVQARFRIEPDTALAADQAVRLARCLDEEVVVVEPPERAS